jgi:hypothetical protein
VSAIGTLISVAVEELGVVIDPADIQFCHLAHRHEESARIEVFFEAPWTGGPAPCCGWQWYPLDALPELIPSTAQALTCYANGQPYSEDGWR